MSTRFLSGPLDLLHLAVIASIFMLVLTHLPASYESYKIRHSVLVGLEHANRAKELVTANVLERKSLAHGWTDSVAGETEGLSVEPHTGVVTVTYPADVDGGGKTLVLVPMYLRGHELYSLTTEVNSKAPLEATEIVWACTSKLTLSKRIFINENLGTLQGKYAPAACRLPWSESDIEKRVKAPLNNR